MGIVQKQSSINTIITFLGFGIGAINALLLYTTFLGKLHYGIVSTVLSGANILMPLMAFGAHSTLVRFFSTYKTEKQREEFLTFMLFWPLVFIIPLAILFGFFYDEIAYYWLRKNPELTDFFWLIPVVGFFMGYFEIFYAWVKVHMQSVVGNLISEVLVRIVVMFLLFSVHWGWLSKSECVYGIAAAYFLQLLIMKLYAFYVKRAVLRFQIPGNIKQILAFSIFIIVSGGVAVMLVDFDKMMIGSMMHISNNAVYSVAIFIATVIIVPSRAMTQIVAPITAKLINENKIDELNELYKSTAINLQIIGGFLMLLIFINVNQFYLLLPEDYRGGVFVVFMIGLSKFYDVLLGNNNSIIINTKYYRMVLVFGLATVLLMIILNWIFIPIYGINGSAFATLLTIFAYNTTKLIFVVRKMKLYPFTSKTLVSFLVLIMGFLVFYFWDFPFHPIVNIALKSILFTVFYGLLVIKLAISKEINEMVLKYFDGR